MNHYRDKTKPQLIEEIESLNNRVEELEQSGFKFKQAEVALQKSEAIFKGIFSQAPVGIELYDSKGNLINANQECLNIFGVEHFEEVEGFKLIEDPNISAEAKTQIRNGEPIDYESEFDFEAVKKLKLYRTTKSGKCFLRIQITPYEISAGGEKGFAVHVQDITERKRAESQLIESKRMLNDVLNTIPVRVFWKDLDGAYLGCNQLFAQDAGRSNPEEVIGDNDYNMGWAEQAELYRSDDRSVIESGQPKINYEEPQTTPEGGIIWLKTSKIPLRNSNGDVYGVLGTYEDISERKKVERSLKESEERFSAITKQSAEGITVATHEGDYVFVNPAFCKMMGYSKEELLKMTVFDMKKEKGEEGRKGFKKSKTNKDGAIIEVVLQRKDKSTFISEVTGKPIKIGDKDLVLGIVKDITERKQAEEVLRENEEKLRNIVEYSTNLFYSHTPDHVLTYISPQTREFFDCEPEEALINWTEFVTNNPINSKGLKLKEEAIKTGERQPVYEFELVGKKGRIIWVEVSEAPIVENGKTVAIVGALIDITERKQAEVALKESKEKFRGLIESSSDWIWEVNAKGVYTYASPQVEEMLGYKPEEVVGKTPFDHMPPEEAERAERIFKVLVKTGKPIVTLENLNLHKEGRQVVLETSGVPIIDADGNVQGFRGMDRDITKRKKAEKELRESEYLLRESQKVASLGSYVLDMPGSVWKSSTILDDVFGIDKNYNKDISGWLNIVHPEDRAMMQDYFAINVLTNHESFNKEYRIIRNNDQGERWVHGLGVLEFSDDGNPIKMIGTIQDITDRKRSELALQKSKERYRSLYQKTPAMLHSIDQEGRLTNVSKYWLKKMGYSLNEVLGRHSTDFMTEESSRHAKEVILPKFYETGNCRDVPYQYVKKNGEVMDALLSAITENDENGELLYSLSVIIDVTDRKRAEESLKKSEARLRQVIDLVPHYIFAKDHKSRFILANSASAESMGTTPEEIIGKTELEIAPVKKEAQVFTKDDAAVISSGKPKFIPEGRFTDVEGKLHFLETIKIPFTASGTKNPSVLGVSVDVTERKKAEEAHWESEERFSRLSEAAFEGIVISDGGKIIDINDQLAEILGYKPEEIIGKTAMEFVAPESRELVMNNIKSGAEGSYEHFALKSDGSIFPVEVQAKTLPYEGRSFRVTTIRDITERKKAEEEIRKLSHSVEQSPAIVMITDISGNIEYVNPKFEEVTGYTAQEVIGKNPSILKSGETTPKEYEILWKTIKAGGEWHGEFHNRKKNGELYWESASISAIKDTKGQSTHYIAIKEDITGRKAMDKRLRESHNRLRSFAERLQMIREEERATIAREIHDDLGQSLTALKMDISWVKNNPEMDVEAKTAKFDMMLDLTNYTIQTVKRIATELRPGILDDLGLVPAIEWQAAEFQNRFKIQCNVSINKSDVIIKDEISIAVFRIFQETLTNIARHSGATKVDIKLNFDVDNKLIMEIADNGVGIDEKQTNSPKSLGLFGMRERANILNGEMEIIGEHGKGTKVRVLIPVSKERVGNRK